MNRRAAAERTKQTKTMAKSAPAPQIEIGLVCDAGSSHGGLHGLTELFGFAGDIAAKRRDADAPPPVRVTHWRAQGGTMRCTHDSAPGAAHAPSVLIIPGNQQATAVPMADGATIAWLRQHHAQGVVLAAVCGGVFILAGTGLLAGRQATTHWAFGEQFAARFPDVLTESDRMVIDYGDVVTAGGVLAWADLGLSLVERFLGPVVMHETARFMLVDPPGREQRFYSGFEPRTKHGDEAILKAQLWLSAHRERPAGVADLAAHTKLSPRTFLRRFVKATGMKPSEYQQKLRVARAREMLEFSRAGIDAIAAKVGYRDTGGFRRIFAKFVGLTPSEYRHRFGGR
jgi:transcriptional regulator GlxA family with amidase domain